MYILMHTTLYQTKWKHYLAFIIKGRGYSQIIICKQFVGLFTDHNLPITLYSYVFYRQIPFWKSDEIDSYDLPITVYSYDSLLADHKMNKFENMNSETDEDLCPPHCGPRHCRGPQWGLHSSWWDAQILLSGPWLPHHMAIVTRKGILL